MLMYYFDNVFLQSYVETGISLKIFVGGEFLHITSLNDVENPKKGVGTDEFGKSKYFDYRNIKSIRVGMSEMDLNDLQSLFKSDIVPKDDEDSAPPKKIKPPPATSQEEPTPEDGDEQEEEPTSKKSKTDSIDPYLLGHFLIKELKCDYKK